MSGGAATSGMTREEKKLVAAVERFQKLEKDRQRMQVRGGAGKRSAVDMEPEGQGATRQKGLKMAEWSGAMGDEVSGGADSSGSAAGGGARMGMQRTSKGTEDLRKRCAAAAAHETTCAPTKKQKRSGGARGLPALQIANTAEQRYHADVRYRALRDGLVGAAVSKFFPAPHARSYSGTVLEYHCATDTYTILYEDEDSEVMPHADLQGILAPVPAMSTANAAKGKTPRAGLCPHQRRRSTCKECGGAGICQHQRIRSRCKECGGAGLCPHQRQRSRCKECSVEKDESMPEGLEELEEL